MDNATGHTEFPEPMGLAATFDTDLIHRIGDAVGNEIRAKFNFYHTTDQKWRWVTLVTLPALMSGLMSD